MHEKIEKHIKLTSSYKAQSHLLKIYYHISKDNKKVGLPMFVGSRIKALVAAR